MLGAGEVEQIRMQAQCRRYGEDWQAPCAGEIAPDRIALDDGDGGGGHHLDVAGGAQLDSLPPQFLADAPISRARFPRGPFRRRFRPADAEPASRPTQGIVPSRLTSGDIGVGVHDQLKRAAADALAVPRPVTARRALAVARQVDLE